MEDTEKRVLRRWRPVIAENVVVTSELIVLLKQAALLTEETMQRTIQVGENEMTKTARIVDLVIACPERGSFSAFCEILAVKHSWMARDLVTDVRIEKGDVQIDDDILREAAMIVHRKFGTSKRLCESDKKSMRDIMATKLQVLTDEWRLSAGKLQTLLDTERILTTSREMKCRQLVTLLSEFLREHEDQLTTHAHGMITTSGTLRRSLDDVSRDALSRLQAGIGELLNQFNRTLTQCDGLDRERNKCLKLLRVEDGHTPLDKVIDNMMSEQDCVLKVADTETSRDTKRLNSRVLDLEDALAEKEELVDDLRAQLNQLQNSSASP